MNIPLLRVAYANDALYLPCDAGSAEMNEATAELLVLLNRCGKTVTEECLHRLNALGREDIDAIADFLCKEYLVNFNWAALTLQWDKKPTGVTFIDFFVTAIFNAVPQLQRNGTVLPCGHFIPEGVFDLDRYTGCPFCGTSFVSAKANLELHDRADLEDLHYWTEDDAKAYALRLVSSSVPLDATKIEQLSNLVAGLGAEFFLQIEDIPSGETRAALGGMLYERGDMRFVDLARTPDDILRILWSLKTGKLHFESVGKAFQELSMHMSDSEAHEKLKLHYGRAVGRAVAQRMEAMDADAGQQCEIMHRHRQMWVRFIRALRLNDNARRYKLAKLTEVLDKFYNRDYTLWGGEVENAHIIGHITKLMFLLCQRPGEFARRLYDTVLDFGVGPTETAFRTIGYKVPLRLLVSLYNSAPGYFQPEDDTRRIVLPGNKIYVGKINRALAVCGPGRRRDLALAMSTLATECIMDVYARRKPMPDIKIFISPDLFRCPAPVGDRGTTTGRAGYALAGQIFNVKGDKVRLFLHWGRGLPAGHYDMDLSCRLLSKDGQSRDVAYYSLNEAGAAHSGDIQYIPDQVGAAEYIELDLPVIKKRGFDYAVFMATAYSCPRLAPDLVVGWMSSDKPMKVDGATGAAYNPADVDMMVNVDKLAGGRGLVFGILDINERTIMWTEIITEDQRLDQVDIDSVMSVRRRLADKMTIGELIKLRAMSSGIEIVDYPDDDTKIYDTPNWHEADIL